MNLRTKPKNVKKTKKDFLVTRVLYYGSKQNIILFINI